ncbi:MAG: hypothetical protein NTY36_17040 [Deltaproteobacteria bacterium]|nr:hypothetical protein [Deltaproteobacteria bacterium]
MIKQKDYKNQDCALPNKSMRTLKKDQDINNTGHIGRAMRFFLNVSVGLMLAFIVFITVGSQRLTPLSVMIATIPFLITLIFFLAFLRQLKRIEEYATKRRNIELVSRVITEYNKSYLICLVMGKVQTFIEEE